jgi:tRNA isopentenyl-2-thiomethyl-A-37 hydroxylase MiaE
MLDKIKNFVKSVSSTTWIVVAVGVLAIVVLSWVSSHAKAPASAPAAVEAPAAK